MAEAPAPIFQAHLHHIRDFQALWQGFALQCRKDQLLALVTQKMEYGLTRMFLNLLQLPILIRE